MLKQVPRAAGTGCYYLNAVSPEGQELYWRCDQPARRPPYRTSRILARHQLVTKIQQGSEVYFRTDKADDPYFKAAVWPLTSTAELLGWVRELGYY
ncbi:stAR-related lipid transfer protein 13-like protein [Willisornis vidua]|uniref:StAR-related lipid transfer protein 13-like protein n=1 Tax=Willisornis vidua TaxID=1566151 RepID=A0ABQ9CKS1_9PASS|nr:stAR-related lipid transfer protein 13-like protein [Willisornis vidua]